MDHCHICGMSIGAEGRDFHGWQCSELSLLLARNFDLKPSDPEYYLLWAAMLRDADGAPLRTRLHAAALRFAASAGWLSPSMMKPLYINPDYRLGPITRISIADPMNPGRDIVLYDAEKEGLVRPTTWWLGALPHVAASLDSAGL